MARSGPQLFARYAYPPNALGYCGPADASVLLGRGAAADAEIARHARQFEGAWAYVELIAAAARIDDPLDPRVVEAYWIGNELLDLIDGDELAGQLRARFFGQPGAGWIPGRAHHGYQVFVVYPWVRLLSRPNSVRTALDVLEQCRIRWGSVVAVEGSRVRVVRRPLELRDGSLALGEPAEQTAALSVDGASPLAGCAAVRVGDTVAMHWDWVCDVLDPAQAAALETQTYDQLARSNAMLAAER
jgi:Family of unknown function (DUF6390)